MSTLLASAKAASKVAGSQLAVGPIGVSEGDLVVLTLAHNQLAIFGISDTLGCVWTELQRPLLGLGTNSWYARVPKGGSLVATVGFMNSKNARAAVLASFNGLAPGPSLDRNTFPIVDGQSPYESDDSGELSQPNELVIGMFALSGPGVDVIVPRPGESLVGYIGTAGGSSGNNRTVAMTWRTVSSQNPVTAGVEDQTTDRLGWAGLVTFKEA